MSRRSRIGLAVGAGFVLMLGILGPSAQARVSKPPSAAKALKTLAKQTAKLPRSSVARSRRSALLRSVRRARRSVRKSPCRSAADLKRYRRTLARTKLSRRVKKSRRKREQARLATLNASATAASRSVLTSRKARRCGGGVSPSRLSEPRTRLGSSDIDGFSASVVLPQLQFLAASARGKTYTKLAAPGTQSPGTPGEPGIPMASELFAIPDGATAELEASNVKTQTIDGVELYPAQAQPVDATPGKPDIFSGAFADPRFKLSKKAYKSRRYSGGPHVKAFGISAGGLNVAALRLPLAQYNPRRKRLKVIVSLDIKVKFKGTTKSFPSTGSPWETGAQALAEGMLNSEALLKGGDRLTFEPCGEELLVITNPATRSAADTYAVARSAAGWRTTVRNTGGIVGTTAQQIRSFIRSHLNSPNCIRPGYVTIIGDDKLVPTFTNGPSGIPSDNPYSTKNDLDELPDIAVGRIIGNDLAQIDASIAKILHYENSPPTGPMLTRALIAAQFQDNDNDGQEDRTFIQFSERTRTGLVARGVEVDRVYDDIPSSNPKRFVDGTSLPTAITKPLFAWDGGRDDISAAWNEGRFMVVHRDHGYSEGWIDPEFLTEDVDALTNDNDNLPVVLSINCSSARYDSDDTSFVQNALVKPTGGAVGAFGDTRDSPSWHNSEIALGFIDAMLPSVLSGEGPAVAMRVGDALVHGKLRLAGLAPPSTPADAGDYDTRKELYLWHYFGDPTMQMFGGGSAPLQFDAGAFGALYEKLAPSKPGDPPPFKVHVTAPSGLAGQVVSLMRGGEVIGKAKLDPSGKTVVEALFNGGEPKPGELSLALDPRGAALVKVPVRNMPARSTTLTQNCPAAGESIAFNSQGPTTVSMTGNLRGAEAGQTVEVSFRHPDRRAAAGAVEKVMATTDADGNWSAQVTTTDRQDIGTWQVSSTYAGNADFAAASAPECPVVVQ